MEEKRKRNRKGLYENIPINCFAPAFRGYLRRHDGSCLFKNLLPPAALKYTSSAKTQTYLNSQT